MHVYHLEHMTKGWFVGDFTPACLHSPHCEVGIKHYSAGDEEAIHHHKIATELTAIVAGRVRMFGQVFNAGQIIQIEPGESTAFQAITDAVTVVVKLPSVAGDKYAG